MRYTCLDVRSPDVNFLRKVMSSSRHDGAAYSRHPCRQSADADIVSAFPLSFSTFLENINILRQTSSTWHRILREFCVLESFQKPRCIHTGAARLLFQFPDVSVVLCDGSVGGEESGLGDVHQHHLLPLLLILIIGECLILYLDVIF